MARQHWLGALIAILGGLLTIPGAYLLNWVTLTWLPPDSRELAPGVAVMLVLPLGLLVVLGVLSAFLVHSWRALYIVPAGYGIGWIVSFGIWARVTVSIGGNDANLDLGSTLQFAVGTFLLLMLAPLVLGAAIGTLADRRRRRPRPERLMLYTA
jgi:hypothetical protein